MCDRMRRSLTRGILTLLYFVVVLQLKAADEISAELVGLNVSLASEKQLVVHDQLVAAQEWGASLDLLDRLRTSSGEVLVKVGPGRFVGLPIAIQNRLCQLPPMGLEVYQKRSNTGASLRLNRARRERDDVALWRIVDELSATSAAPVAIQSLAAEAAGRGDLELALRLWGRLIENRDLEPLAFPPSIVSLTSNDTEESRIALIKAIFTRHAMGEPLTAKQLEKVSSDDFKNWMFAGHLVRDSLIAASGPVESVNLESIRWTTVATANCPLAESQVPLSAQLGRSGLVVVNNGQQIRALNVNTGEPFWPTGLTNDIGVVWEGPLIGGLPTHKLPCQITGGVCSSDRYFGVMGDAPHWRPRPGLVPLAGALIALDTTQGQGRVLWRIESQDLPEPGWLFHGGPALSPGAWPSDDLVVVPLCRPAPQVELAVAAFSQDDGHLVWWMRIGTCAGEPGQPLPQTQVLVKGGLVVARTLAGVIVTLDSRQGKFHWASTAMVDSPPSQQGSHAPLIDCSAGVLVVADPIQSQVAGLSLDSGEMLWQLSLPFPTQGVVCASHGKVLIAGTRLRAVSLWTGTPLWEHGFDDPSVAGTGVPVLDGQTAMWPTRSSLWGLDLSTGAIESQRLLSTTPVAVPMQLTLLDSHWLLSLPDAILCGQRSSIEGRQ